MFHAEHSAGQQRAADGPLAAQSPRAPQRLNDQTPGGIRAAVEWALVKTVGPALAKQLMFTGDSIDERTAAAWGFTYEAVPAAEIDAATRQLVERFAGVPRGYLAMHNFVVDQVIKTMGLKQALTLGPRVHRRHLTQP